MKPDREAYLRRVSAPSGPWVQLSGAMLREVFAEVDALRAECAQLASALVRATPRASPGAVASSHESCATCDSRAECTVQSRNYAPRLACGRCMHEAMLTRDGRVPLLRGVK